MMALVTVHYLLVAFHWIVALMLLLCSPLLLLLNYIVFQGALPPFCLPLDCFNVALVVSTVAVVVELYCLSRCTTSLLPSTGLLQCCCCCCCVHRCCCCFLSCFSRCTTSLLPSTGTPASSSRSTRDPALGPATTVCSARWKKTQFK